MKPLHCQGTIFALFASSVLASNADFDGIRVRTADASFFGDSDVFDTVLARAAAAYVQGRPPPSSGPTSIRPRSYQNPFGERMAYLVTRNAEADPSPYLIDYDLFDGLYARDSSLADGLSRY